MRKIKISELFTIIKGKSLYTKTYGSNHHGEYPVFSASNHAPLTYINHYDFDGKYMTWATNGFAGYIKIIDGKFSINGDRGIMIPKHEKISIEYVKFALEPLLRELAKGRRGDNNENEFTKVYPRMVENTEINFPIDEHGSIDEEQQKELVGVYLVIDELKQRISHYQQQLEQLTITVAETSYPMKEVRIDKIFDVLPVSKKIKKEDLQGKGIIPTYSSKYENDGVIGYYTEAMYDCSPQSPILTFGDHTKATFLRTIPFSVVDNVKVLKIKKEFEKMLDYSYIVSLRKPLMPNLGYARHRSECRNISISIPILPDGSFDLTAQQQIAQTYETISQIKSQMLTKMQELQDVQVVV